MSFKYWIQTHICNNSSSAYHTLCPLTTNHQQTNDDDYYYYYYDYYYYYYNNNYYYYHLVTHLQLQLAQSCPLIFKRRLERQHFICCLNAMYNKDVLADAGRACYVAGTRNAQ